MNSISRWISAGIDFLSRSSDLKNYSSGGFFHYQFNASPAQIWQSVPLRESHKDIPLDQYLWFQLVSVIDNLRFSICALNSTSSDPALWYECCGSEFF